MRPTDWLTTYVTWSPAFTLKLQLLSMHTAPGAADLQVLVDNRYVFRSAVFDRLQLCLAVDVLA